VTTATRSDMSFIGGILHAGDYVRASALARKRFQ
jgi:hypothetical protein